MDRWTFLTNHAVVLVCLHQNPKTTAIEVSQTIGITERAVRKIIADLEREGYIEKKKMGKRVQYTVKQYLPLRQMSQKDKSVNRLLWALSVTGGNEPISLQKKGLEQ